MLSPECHNCRWAGLKRLTVRSVVKHQGLQAFCPINYTRILSSMANLADMSRLSLDDTSRDTQYMNGFADFAAIGSHDLVPFSEREEQILALHDQLEELRLEIALSEELENQAAGEHERYLSFRQGTE